MKIRNTVIALASLAALGSAQALTPAEVVAERNAGNLKEVRIAGASALRLALGGYLQEVANPTTLDVYFNDAAGANHRAYAFRLAVQVGNWPAGTAVLVTKRDAGGSGQGVGPIITADATQAHMVVDASCVATANASPATDIQKPTFTCAGTAGALADAGLSDVEPALLEAPINAGANRAVDNLDAAGFVQNVFGVAVNKKLYLALQKAQGLVSGNDIDEDAAKQPSIPATFVRGALTGQLLGSNAQKKGWNLLIPTSVDAAVNSKKVNVCRRTAGSGTQAASNAYFANNPCGGASAYIPSNAGGGAISATGALTIVAGASTGNVEDCLGKTAQDAAGDAYALGVIGRENNPRANGGDKGYRFVKLSGVAPERANVINGSYEFVTESTMQWAKSGANAPTGDKLEFLKTLRANIGKASVLAQLDPDLQAGLVATPATIPAGTAWDDLAPEVKAFTSHTARAAAKSCTPVRMAK
ncbi:hypothetical protein G8A07_09185 [Roseateles sp. DAIF2]|uniref:hypothetical protein n=1 Tax=Roseateles sp. DAIF2 TaxID=2714952 RepID=UPI0018A284DB|nr:hypothetical protein [Roseateles sp. DAIF2]QPF73072.1 hypothetical protein G8A07_09185 [Roseateles sp. DAIF2]